LEWLVVADEMYSFESEKIRIAAIDNKKKELP
jgi:hypothetical protein